MQAWLKAKAKPSILIHKSNIAQKRSLFCEVWEKREGDRQKKFDSEFMARVDN